MRPGTHLDPHPRHGDSWSIDRSKDFLSAGGRQLSAFWSGSKFLAFNAEIDPGTARRWLPPGLTATDPARALVFVVDYVKTGLGFDYREVGVLLHATLRRKPVLHVAWMVVDDDTAMILGRELLGFPKKMAEINIEFASDSARAVVRRRGVDLLTLDARLGDPIAETRVFPHPIVNVRGIPGLLPNMLLRIEGKEHFHSGRTADIDVKVKDSPFDPLAELGLSCTQKGLHAIVDIGVNFRRRVPTPRPWPVAGFVSPAWLIRAYPFRTW